MFGDPRTAVAYSLGLVASAVALTGCAPAEQPAPRSESPTAAGLVLSEPATHLDTTAREPMLVQHPDGTLFVAGYQRENPVVEQSPALWKSSDGGSSWERVDVGTVEQGAVGNSDVDLAVGPDGTLYFLTMGFDRTVGEGTHVAVGVSRDVGATWSWNWLVRAPRVDRPWIVITSDGTAHVIWNDGAGVHYTRGDAAGSDWSEPRTIAERGGSSHLAAGPNDELAVRIIPLSASGAQYHEGAEWLLVSTDGGDSWQRRQPPGTREYAGLGQDEELPRWVEPIAFDDAGALYSLWSEGDELWLGRSADLGASWQTWPISRSEDSMFFPYLAARDAGELAATWFAGRGDSLAAHVARIDVGGDGAPEVVEAPAFRPRSWTPDDPPVRDPAGEYLPVIFLADGGLAVASPIQDAAGERFGFAFRTAGERQ